MYVQGLHGFFIQSVRRRVLREKKSQFGVSCVKIYICTHLKKMYGKSIQAWKKINARYDPAGADADFLFKVAIEGTKGDIKEHTVLRCTFG